MKYKLFRLLAIPAVIYLVYLFFETEEGLSGGNNPILLIGAGLFLFLAMVRGDKPESNKYAIPTPRGGIFKAIKGIVITIVFAFIIAIALDLYFEYK